MIMALIPLRGGSKGIPQKNIKLIAGKPLAQWVIDEANKSKLFDYIYVSTDCDEITSIVKNVNVLKRPAQYATDTATTESVMLHITENVDFDVLTTIQATSPQITVADLTLAIIKFKEENLDSMFSAHRVKKFFWTDDIKPINYNPFHRPMRQQWNGTIVENGAFYITKKEILTQYKCRLGGKIGAYVMDKEIIDIDDMDDWERVEKLLLREQGD